MDQGQLSIVGWLWRGLNGKSRYEPEHVNTWARMLHRNLTLPHRFVLMTDRPEALYDPLVTPVPLWEDLRRYQNGNGKKPQCYVRLKAFSAEAEAILGRRFVSIDLDVLALGNLDSIFDRPEDFLIIRRTPVNSLERASTYQASMWMMTAGSRRQVWDDFKGDESIAAAAKYIGSDQAWIRHRLGDQEKGWTEEDGVYCFRNIQRNPSYRLDPPRNAKFIAFNTTRKPWDFKQPTFLCSKCGGPVTYERKWFDWVWENYH